MSFADNSTVIGDTTTRKDPREDWSKIPSHSSDKAKQKSVSDFIAADDYTLEDRPFFVTIGKDGLIGALQKLDKQLVDVSLLCFDISPFVVSFPS
jgi:hypothetical protein